MDVLWRLMRGKGFWLSNKSVVGFIRGLLNTGLFRIFHLLLRRYQNGRYQLVSDYIMTTNGCLHTQTRVSQMPEASEGHLDIPKDENAVETATL